MARLAGTHPRNGSAPDRHTRSHPPPFVPPHGHRWLQDCCHEPSPITVPAGRGRLRRTGSCGHHHLSDRPRSVLQLVQLFAASGWVLDLLRTRAFHSAADRIDPRRPRWNRWRRDRWLPPRAPERHKTDLWTRHRIEWRLLNDDPRRPSGVLPASAKLQHVHTSRSRFQLAGAICAALMVAGIVVYRTAPQISFGWFAYSPLPDEFSISSGPGLSTRQLTGLVMIVVGGIGASATAGYVLGLRNSGRQA